MTYKIFINILVVGTVLSSAVKAEEPTVIASNTCLVCCSRNCLWKLTSDGVLTIYGSGEMGSSTNPGHYYWHSYGDQIKSVVIEGANEELGTTGITSIGQGAFSTTHNIESISIPSTVTSIGNSAFAGTKLDQDDLKNVDASLLLNGALRDMSYLTQFTIPDGVTSIGNNAFRGTGLTSIDIPDSVTSIGHLAFAETDLKSLVIPDSVTYLGDTFAGGIEGLESIVIGSGVSNFTYYAFSYGGENPLNTSSNTTIYCPENLHEACVQRPPYNPSQFQTYTKNDNGIYETQDGKFYLSPELMVSDTNGKNACKSLSECEKILSALNNHQPILVNRKFYNSLSDWLNGNYVKKRIYTVEEATKLSKPTGNKFRIRYK